MEEVVAIVLAAGQGTRMKSKKSKVLHELAGKPMIRYVMEAVTAADIHRIVLVVGHEAEQVRVALGDAVEYVEQREQLGTGHAVMQAMDTLSEDVNNVLVLCGDAPLIRTETLREIVQTHRESRAALTMLTAHMDDPTGYGRILRKDGNVVAIVEEAAASIEQKAIKEWNTGVYCFDLAWLRERLSLIQRSAKGEYYLTDMVGIAADENMPIASLTIDDAAEAMGINDRAQLAEAEEIVRWTIRNRLMRSGVTLIQPSSIFIDEGVEIGQDTVIYPGTVIKGTTRIGEDCVIGPNSFIVNSKVGDNCTVFASMIEDSTIDERVGMGPFCHIRGGTHLAPDVDLGNFAEIKNSFVDSGTKMHHFSYLGDATVGKRVNIAAGTITCNFDSESGNKSRTILEDDVAVGSDTMLVAPVRLAHGAVTGAGSVVTKDIPADSLAIGVPAKVLRKVRRKV